MKSNQYKKCNQYKKIVPMLTAMSLLAAIAAGCGQQSNQSTPSGATPPPGSQNTEASGQVNSESVSTEDVSAESPAAPTQNLQVRFGDDGEAFLMHLYDNETASAIARHVGTSDWRLPIYNYDESDSMEYYDIPSRYEIPSTSENITLAKAGDVYYSEPNRIILLYEDGDFSGEYTKVGEFDVTEEFQAAVRDNPVLEGWENKIVLISTADNGN